ncbi:hypothetical protein WN944_019551 [Citrus x changshan-huyou]|uniref:Far1-related sequence 3 n=1 Tax=Citrus x changshan-huyou TaxID=2935761 RepID=A0AAP0LVH0_9ROSI
MGVDAMRIGVQMRKVMSFSMRTCYGLVCNHPFLVGFMCFLIFLYRSSPFVFSLLVSASPVLVCAAVLLGTLLSFGQPNIPEIEIEKEEKVTTTREIASLKTGVVEDDTVVTGDENVSFETLERYVGKGSDIVENDLDDSILVDGKGIEVQEDGGLVNRMLFINVNSREMQCEKQAVEEVARESNDLLAFEKNGEVHEEKPQIEGKLIDGEVLDNLDSNNGLNGIENPVVEDGKIPEELISTLKKDQLVSTPDSSLIDALKEDQPDSAPGSSLIDALKEDHLGSAPGSSSIDALKEDHLGSAPGSSSIDALKEDHLGSAPGSSLIDALKEDHFAFAPGSFLIDALKEDELGSAPGLSWRRLEEDYGEGNGADGDESLDSGSDGAESSSPDASMADIMPMLDELHPLLQLEAPRPACGSHDGSDAGSERLHKSDDESLDSEEDTDNQGESVDSEEDTDNQGEGEDDNDDDEEEGVTTKGEKEDESKSVIKWTEVDQKNLMDLGTSELERNQRLENLIARRRARKIMRLMAEKNLIDLESSDLPFSIPPIATTRRNPFELPDDTYDDMAIPGSAPSVLLPSRNPFDLPYDSNEEKPDLKGDSFQQEFSALQQKELVYRRNETFSIGPSVLGGSRHERQDFKWRPYFLPERFLSEEGTGYPSFQRQLSEVSESKLSSLPDSESVNSAVDEDDRKSNEQVPEQFSSEGISYATLQRQISVISESKASSVPDTESVSSAVDEDDKKLNEPDDSRETEGISNIDHGANHVECGSKSSGEDSLDIEPAGNRDVHRDEVVITLGNVENLQENEPSFSELKENESHLEAEAEAEPGEENSSRSSYSSLSEVDEYISDARKEEGLTTLEKNANVIEESGVSTHTLPESSEFQFMSEVVDRREPVYDSSPPGMERFLSFTSISSDTQLEISEMTALPVLLECVEKESEAHSDDTDKNSAGFEEICGSPSQVNAVDENESVVREVAFTEASELDVKEVRSSGGVPNFSDGKESVVSSFSSDTGPSEDYTVYRGERFFPDKKQVVSSSHDSDILVGVRQNPYELDSAAPSADSRLSEIEGQVPSMVFGHVLVQPSASASETETVEERAKDKADLVQHDQDDVNLSRSSDKLLLEEGMADKDRDLQHDADEAHLSKLDADINDDDYQDVVQEQDPPVVTDPVPMIHLSLSSSEADHVLELSSDNKETHQLEEAQSSLLEKNDSGLHQDMDANGVSANFSNEDVPSGEKSSSELEKQLSWSDKSPSYDLIQQAPTILMESIKEVNVANNENASDDHNHEDKTLKSSSYLTSGSPSTPFESPELRSPRGEEVNMVNGNAFKIHDDKPKTEKKSASLTSDSCSTTPFESPEDQSPGGEDIEEDILDRMVYGDAGHVKEHFSLEAYEKSNNEEADEIKEIDEGLLSELDTVGDFSVKEVVGKSLNTEPTPAEITISSIESLHNDSFPLETNLDLPVLEAKSTQDIVLAFKQLEEGADVADVILPSMLESEVVKGESNSDIPVVEAQSVEDILAVLKQVSQSDLAELPKPLESNDHSAEVEKVEAVPTEQIESSSDVHSGIQEDIAESNGHSAEVEKVEVVSTEQIESSSDVHSGIQEDIATAAGELKLVPKETSENSSPNISDDKKEYIVKEDQVPTPFQMQGPVVLNEDKNAKGT